MDSAGDLPWLRSRPGGGHRLFLRLLQRCGHRLKYILRDDVRTHGSGNAGLTNFYRIFGGPLTFVVILLDVVKAVWRSDGRLAAGRMGRLGGSWQVLGGLFCLLGHMFPCMFRFKGGKGILSGGTIAIMIDWRVALVCWGGFLILAALTKWVSLGSLCTGITFPLTTWFVYQNWVLRSWVSSSAA